MHIDDTNIQSILHNLEMAYEFLSYANRDLQDPDIKRKIHTIKKSISTLYNQMESKELEYRSTLEEKEQIKKLLVD